MFQIINPTKRSKIMNKKQIIRTLAAHAADAVVLLEKIWPDDDT